MMEAFAVWGLAIFMASMFFALTKANSAQRLVAKVILLVTVFGPLAFLPLLSGAIGQEYTYNGRRFH